jgi:hypothetical protein
VCCVFIKKLREAASRCLDQQVREIKLLLLCLFVVVVVVCGGSGEFNG